MPHQEALTVVARLDPAGVPALLPALDELRKSPAHNDILPFGALPGCHFGRVLFLPASNDLQGQPIPPQLLLLSDCDGSADDHLEAMVDVAGGGLDALFGACEGYPARPARRAERAAFLRNQSISVKANYVHRPGRSVDQIRRESQLRAALQAFLGERGFGELPALELRKRIQAFVRSDADCSWAAEAPEPPSLRFRAERALDFATLPLGAAALGPLLVPALLSLLALVRMQERSDQSEHIRPAPEHVRALAELEDLAAHNGFTAAGFVKPGWVRQTVLQLVLPLIGWGTRNLFTRDSLAGVKSIHFARWIPLDHGRRVVFASNYDGSLESYNNDFIDLVSWGLNLVFSNGFGYPKTDWLVFGGAQREQEFKDFLRRHQVPTPIWYSAYPELTAVQVERNAALRAGLRGHMTEREAQRWLRLL
ncbi:MAG TPA: hypothetical protein VJV78_16010 [Polyangiales bacterium]|nr:hypothetical protein [Polyangiales bacterium]